MYHSCCNAHCSPIGGSDKESHLSCFLKETFEEEKHLEFPATAVLSRGSFLRCFGDGFILFFSLSLSCHYDFYMSKVSAVNASGYKARRFVKTRRDRPDATWQPLVSAGASGPPSGHTLAAWDEDARLWHRGHSAVCHRWRRVGEQRDTQARTKCPRGAGTARTTGSVGTTCCSSLPRWAWGSSARRSGALKKRRRKRTGRPLWPGEVWTSLCRRLVVPPPLNRTAPDINTTLSPTSWRSPRRRLFTLKSWAGELTRHKGSCCRGHV